MIRRSRATLRAVLGVAALAALLAGCSTAMFSLPPQSGRPNATPSVTAAPSYSASASASAAASASVAPSATPEPTVPLPHADAALEDKLPSTINGVALVKWSMLLSGYMATPEAGGDKALYPAWLVQFGKIPSDVKIAFTVSFADLMDFQARAIQVPGVSAASLSSGFADTARKAGWTVTSVANYLPGKSILKVTNPATGTAGIVYAKGDVLYEIVTNSQDLVNEALILLP